MPKEEKLLVIDLRILNEVRQYYAKFSKGMPMQSLSWKYHRSLAPLGGFPERILDLQERGLISVDYAENGARRVSPGGTRVSGTPSAKNVTTPSKYWY